MLLLILLTTLLGVRNVEAKVVFAHFMVGNTVGFDVATWKTNMQLAQTAHIDAFALNIDAFALNIAYGFTDNEKQIGYAFAAANSNTAHFQYGGLPLVSTFEGTNQASDWKTINSGDTSCFFIPDYSSLGAGPAVAAGGGGAQGLFSWAAWPTGPTNTSTYVDASYKKALAGKPYMMPVSPWFFTNMPGFDKNWLWSSGDLWHQRWQQVVSLYFEPEFLEIISWNDFGESHYIGPLDDTQYEAFDRGKTPCNYVKNMPHDAWREHLPYYIDLYKTGTATFAKESIVTWFRTTLAGACADGGVGIYYTSLPIDTTSGAWSVAVVLNGATAIDYAVPQGVSSSCPNRARRRSAASHRARSRSKKGGLNPQDVALQSRHVHGGLGRRHYVAPVYLDVQGPLNLPPLEVDVGKVTSNFGNDNGLCSFACKRGYCPLPECSSCSTLSCPASGVGVVASCSATGGLMNYKEIDSLISRIGAHATHDAAAGTNYFTYGDKQWTSYDNPDSIVAKVKYAKSKGLLGLAVWSVEQDNDAHDLLNVTLYPAGLGGVADHTGSGTSGPAGQYNDITVSSCAWSQCGLSTTPGCAAGQQVLTTNRCSVEPGTGKKRYKALCCPLDKTPDPDFCGWQGYSFGLGVVGLCTSGCKAGYVGMADDNWVINAGGEGTYGPFGHATYCCSVERAQIDVCAWKSRCVSLGANERPVDESSACPTGNKFVTYAKGIPGWSSCEGDESVNKWLPYCCNNFVDTSSFAWAGSRGTERADNDLGGGADCIGTWVGWEYTDQNQYPHTLRPLCADPNALSFTINTLPVPLKNLFPGVGPEHDADKQRWHVELDPSMGSADPTPETSTNANDNSFGWYIMSGPADELTSLNKRDGSHWELFDCHDALDETRRHTVRAVCTTHGAVDSNCNNIHLGNGVAETVVEMPQSCGPGRYAMAVSLAPSADQTLPPYLLAKRAASGNAALPEGVQVYDFTFDFDFTPLQKRGTSNVLLRIDYSDDPGYWNKIRRSQAEVYQEVRREHGGSYKRYLDHFWHEDKRATPEHELHELHARWFSSKFQDWVDTMRDVDNEWKLVRHRVDETTRWDLVNDNVQCDFDNGISATGHLKVRADISVNVETAAMSHVLFRNTGKAKASFNVDALASLSFDSGPVELVGLQNFGVTFTMPGIVTIGPNFRLLANVEGTATLHGQARVDVDLADWDYTQTYPSTSGGFKDDAVQPNRPLAVPPSKGLGVPDFRYDVDARGEIAITLTPQISLGVVFASTSIPDASIDFEVSGRAAMYGTAGSSLTEAWQYCYGINGKVELFARVNAPVLFGVDINNYYQILPPFLFDILPEVCASASGSVPAGTTTRSTLDAAFHVDQPGNLSTSTTAVTPGRSPGPLAASLNLKRDGILTGLLCPKKAEDLGGAITTACSQLSGYDPDELTNPDVTGLQVGSLRRRRRSDQLLPDMEAMMDTMGSKLTMHHADHDHSQGDPSINKLNATHSEPTGSLLRRGGVQNYLICEGETASPMKYATPSHPDGTVLYDCLDWGNCNDFRFGLAAAPHANRSYIAEHILERQMLQQFLLWAKLDLAPEDKPSAKTTRPADTTGSRDRAGKPLASICRYFEYFWEDAAVSPINGVRPWDTVGAAWPSRTVFAAEIVRIESQVNGAKARAFSQATADVQKILLAQSNRLAAQLDAVETALAAQWAASRTGASYRPMGLGSRWKTFMQEYTPYVSERVEGYLNLWVGHLAAAWLRTPDPDEEEPFMNAQLVLADKIRLMRAKVHGLAKFPSPF
ncbi:glycosyl hydrolase family 71-domain-containing protein [Podospora appendiculata]|uniref:chitinase n=1 Tax=Podospora appendiculata TaxID=314037 RepID=A0AAE0XD40_9PEZI|nr:glycosyl hydrolase family 71-domain-containing protein [Podospora appendiculata]